MVLYNAHALKSSTITLIKSDVTVTKIFCANGIKSYHVHKITIKNRGGTDMSKSNCIVKTGEKPGKGSYNCTNCNTEVTLGEYDKMPPCPKCSNNEFTC